MTIVNPLPLAPVLLNHNAARRSWHRGLAMGLSIACWLSGLSSGAPASAVPHSDEQGRGMQAGRTRPSAAFALTDADVDGIKLLIQMTGQLESQVTTSEAIQRWQKIVALCETLLGPEHPVTAESLNRLAKVYLSQGRYGEAETLLRRALAISEKALGPSHQDIANHLSDLARLSWEAGRQGEAERLFKRALMICEATLGPEHPDTATSLNNLAVLLGDQGRYGEAEALFRRALVIYEKRPGPEHPSTASGLNNLAGLFAKQGRYQEAEPLYQRGLAILQKALGPEHPSTATGLNNLGVLQYNQGHYGGAEALYNRSLGILERGLGPDHPTTALVLNHLAAVLLLQTKTSAASLLLSRLNRSQADWLRRELPLQPRELRMGLLQKQPDAVATSFALLDQDPSAAALALESRLNRQGLLAEIEQRQRLLLGSSPQVRQLGERLAGLDRQLASVTLSPSQREQLRAQRQQLEADLNRLLPTLRIEPVSIAKVAAALNALAPQGLLVEFQKYRPWGRTSSGKADWGPPRYVALLLHPDGRSASVPLGPAAPIDQAIERALAASAANTAEADSLWAQLSGLVVNPLASQLRGVTTLFLSPDGALHRVPFAALPAPASGGQLLNQAFQLRLLTTGRELIRLQQPAALGSAPVLIANPDYSALRRSADARGGSARQPGATAPTPTPATRERQQRSGALGSTKAWTPLPGTAEEARVLAPLLGIPQPITGAAANAPLVLRQNAPRILHIATHGFFQPDQPDRPADPLSGTPAGTAPAAARQEDPLLRSGLVLAGANHPDADPTDDGYLTAAEVTGINLNGTQLVTLSACESGLGDLQSGEGVYGLQRSLAVAGARSTLLSLWPVDDDATRAFMQAFYSRLLRGEGRADALAHTQNEFRNHPNPLYRDLYVWAAFQLTGDWRPISSGG